MSLLQRLNPLDRLAGTILFVLAVCISAIVAYATWIGISVSLYTVNPRNQIGPYEVLTLTFSQPVRPHDVENQLQILPSTPGKFEWQDDHTVRFVPARAYQGTVVVHLVPGQLGTGGEWMRKDASWSMSVRQPSILYLNYSQPQNELMTVPLDGGTPRQLTSTGGKIYDFDASPSGDQIAYSLANDKNGFDLWLADRSGQNARRVLDCGAGRCTSPVWSPDGKLIAYNREAAGLTPAAANGAPRPWIVDSQTGENRPVFSDPQAIGYSASWSPDGNWLETYDGIAAQLRVVNLISGKQIAIPSNLGLLGSWSPDSTALMYPDQTMGVDNISKTYLYRADLKNGQIGIFLGKTSDTVDYAYGNPAWSPAGDQVVFSMRPNPKKPDRQLWLIRVETLGGPIITQDPGYTYNYYQWDPWGTSLLIQQISLTRAYMPQVGVWSPGRGYHLVVENGINPRWLP